jgi:hypothetical protein
MLTIETNQRKLPLQRLCPSETTAFGYKIKDHNRHKNTITTSNVVLVEEKIKFVSKFFNKINFTLA